MRPKITVKVMSVRKMLLNLCFLLFSFAVWAQKLKAIEVPLAVISAFNIANPAVLNPEWYKEDSKFKVKFIVDKRPRTATYSESGTLVVHDAKVALTLIPSAIKAYLDKNYSGKNIDKVLKMTAANGKTSYLISIDGGDLIFDANGRFVKATPLK